MAGFFDGAFDPAAFGASGGVLPPWLQQTIDNLQQGPSKLQGFPPAQLPMAPGTYPTGSPVAGSPITQPQGDAPPEAQPAAAPGGMPSALGNMPIPQNPFSSMFGGMFAGGPPGPSASPSPPGAAAAGAPAAAPASPGIGDRLGAGLLGFAHGGAPIPALANLISGLATGQRSDPQGMMQQQIEATRQALINTGLPPAVAQAAALNPKILETVAPNIYTKPKWGVIGHDVAGNQQYGWIDEGKQTVRTPTGTGGQIGMPQDAQGNPLQGDDLLAHLKRTDPTAASMVEAIRRGDAAVTGRNLQKYMPLATLVDPTLSQFNYDVRKKTALDFAPSGKASLNVRSLETVGGHLGKMMSLFDELGNGWSPDGNSIKNWIATRLGHQSYTNFETAATGVANELGTVFRSFGMSDAEVRSWRERISSSQSPEQFNGAMSTLLDMLKTRRDAIAEQYQQGMGKPLPAETFQKLDAAIRTIEDKLSGRAPQAAAGSITGRPGESIVGAGQPIPIPPGVTQEQIMTELRRRGAVR